MSQTYIYNIAGFDVFLSGAVDADKLLPSFSDFRSQGGTRGERLFAVEVVSQMLAAREEAEEWDVSDSDMGHVRLMKAGSGYRIELFYEDGRVHQMQADAAFTSLQVYLCMQDRYVGQALSSLLRIAFSQAILFHGGISIHASAVVRAGYAYLFMGKSGTGKSTHAALWLRCFPDAELLNDDNPVIRKLGETVCVYGSPWSGKTPCYKNKGYKLGGAVRLVQAEVNRFFPQENDYAFIAFLPGCSVIRKDEALYDMLCSTLAQLVDRVQVGVLHCLPDAEAAVLCAAALRMA